MSAVSLSNPRAEYDRRLQAAYRERAKLTRLDARLRLAQTAALFCVVAPVLFFALAFIHPAWLAIPAVAFVVLFVWWRRVRQASYRVNHRIDYYERGLVRLDGLWTGTGDSALPWVPAAHPYAADLDLFGVGSLFERLSTARTQAGTQTLANWLLSSASLQEIRERQEAIDELRGRLDLREEMSLLGTQVPRGIDLEGLIRWGVEPQLLPSRGQALLLYGLMLLVALLLVGWLSGSWIVVLCQVLVVGHLWFWALFARRVPRIVAPLERRARDLTVWNHLVQRIEREPFQSAALVRLQQSLHAHGQWASSASSRLARLAARLRLMEYPELRWIGWLELRTTRVAFALEAWRRLHGADIARWVEAVAAFEALASLAAYAYENPEDPFAELVESRCFEGEGLGHPLLPRARCVTNDIHLGGTPQALLVTGSNMSGKSTLLRAVGINAVLALAGAPVRARRLRLSRLAIAASLRVQDSLQAGESRFLVEIHRLRQMIELAQGSLPLLFLIDEILQGTNPADRRQGAAAVILGLLRLQAMGLVTTHDLPLTVLAEDPSLGLANVHFSDRLDEGGLDFDYLMRPGVVKQSNALALMRMVGLPDGTIREADQ